MPFRAQIAALSDLIADSVIGAVIATAASGARWVLGQGPNSYTPNIIYGYSGDSEETQPANIRTETVVIVGPNNDSGQLVLEAPEMNSGGTRAKLQLSGNGPAGKGNFNVFADEIRLNGGASTGLQPHVFFGDYDQCFDGGRAVLVGSTPPAGTPKLELAGTVVVSTNASGNVFLPFGGSGFFNGLVSLIVTSGDGNAWVGNVTPYGYGLTGANVACRNPTPVNATVRLNFIAIGW